jgi:hypothetical protein
LVVVNVADDTKLLDADVKLVLDVSVVTVDAGALVGPIDGKLVGPMDGTLVIRVLSADELLLSVACVVFADQLVDDATVLGEVLGLDN